MVNYQNLSKIKNSASFKLTPEKKIFLCITLTQYIKTNNFSIENAT